MAHPVCGQGARFFLVALAGLVIDLSIASALALSGLSLAVAAAIGFAAGLAFNYVAHARFTFRQPREHASVRQVGLFLLSSLAVLGVRLAVLALLEAGLPARLQHPTTLLLMATSASFVANFLILSGMVFKHSVPPGQVALPANEEGRAYTKQEKPLITLEPGPGVDETFGRTRGSRFREDGSGPASLGAVSPHGSGGRDER